MPLDIVGLRPQNWSRLKPYYWSTLPPSRYTMRSEIITEVIPGNFCSYNCTLPIMVRRATITVVQKSFLIGHSVTAIWKLLPKSTMSICNAFGMREWRRWCFWRAYCRHWSLRSSGVWTPLWTIVTEEVQATVCFGGTTSQQNLWIRNHILNIKFSFMTDQTQSQRGLMRLQRALCADSSHSHCS